MQLAHLIFGVIGTFLFFLLLLRLADPALWDQASWQIGLKIVIGVLVLALVLTLLYLLAPESLSEM